jgi:hypothetical protein
MTASLWKRKFFVSIQTKQIPGKQCTVCLKIINSTIMRGAGRIGSKKSKKAM